MAQGSIKKENNSWYYVIGYPDPITGKWKQKKKRGFKTKKDAQAALTKALNQLNEGTYVEPSKMTLNEFLDIWIENKKRTVKVNTLQKYLYILQNHIRPIVGQMQTASIKPLHISQLYSELHEKDHCTVPISDHLGIQISRSQRILRLCLQINSRKGDKRHQRCLDELARVNTTSEKLINFLSIFIRQCLFL